MWSAITCDGLFLIFSQQWWNNLPIYQLFYSITLFQMSYLSVIAHQYNSRKLSELVINDIILWKNSIGRKRNKIQNILECCLEKLWHGMEEKLQMTFSRNPKRYFRFHINISREKAQLHFFHLDFSFHFFHFFIFHYN